MFSQCTRGETPRLNPNMLFYDMIMERIYLDNSATTRVDELVLKAMLPCFRENFGNAGSVHLFGQEARAVVEEARRSVAELLSADTREIVFT